MTLNIFRVLILFGILASGCGSALLFNKEPTVTGPLKIDRSLIYFPTFVMKKKINWYGERDRNWVSFYRIDPLYTYFSKNLMTSLGIKDNTGVNFAYQAKSASIKSVLDPDYLIQTNGIVLEGKLPYRQLTEQLKIPKESHYLLLQTVLELNRREMETSTAIAFLHLILKTATGETVFSKVYTRIRTLPLQEYLVLFAYHQRTREKIASKTHHLLSEMFVLLTNDIIKDLKTVLR